MKIDGKEVIRREQNGYAELVEVETGIVLARHKKQNRDELRKEMNQRRQQLESEREQKRNAYQKEYQEKIARIKKEMEQEERMRIKQQEEQIARENKIKARAQQELGKTQVGNKNNGIQIKKELDYLPIQPKQKAKIYPFSIPVPKQATATVLSDLCTLFGKRYQTSYTLIPIDLMEQERYGRSYFMVQDELKSTFEKALKNQDWKKIDVILNMKAAFWLGTLRTKTQHQKMEPTIKGSSFAFGKINVSKCVETFQKFLLKRQVYRFHDLYYQGKLPTNSELFIQKKRTACFNLEQKLTQPISPSFFNPQLPDDMKYVIHQYLGYEKEKQRQIS